ncbi:hypothetical protein D3C80_1082880 [compost metagenome]
MVIAGFALALLSAPISVQAVDADPVPAQAEAPRFEAVTEGEAFRLALPQGASMGRRALIDFDLYQVSIDGRPVLGLYEGFAADVADWVDDPRQPGRQTKTVGGQPVEYFWNRSCGRASQVHAWLYQGASSDAASIGRAMADSIVLKPCDGH